jgi:phosphate uptake regulator
METRKVQLAGNSTYTISLPKTWAVEQGIETGQPLRLRPGDGRLVLELDRDGESSTPTVDVTDASPTEVRDTVRAMYTLGYDGFDLRVEGGPSTAVRRAVSESAAELAGLEVEREDGATIRCRDLLDTSALSVPRVVSRLEFAALSAHRGATGALVDGGADRTPHVERVERHARDASAQAALVERCLRRALADVGVLDRLGSGRATLLEHFRVAGELERVGSLAADLVRATDARPPSVTPPDGFTECAQRTRLSIEHATDAVLSDVPPAEAREVHRETRRCAEAVRSLAADVPDSRTWFRALCTLERTADCGTTLGTHALRSALDREG